jgi:peptide/nickel transport system ATP-binding protein
VIPALAIRDLTVVFGHGSTAFVALDSATFEVSPGETFGIVGESGSGKSTLLRVICGLQLPQRGSIQIDGVTVPTPRSRAFYQTVQMVFQDPYASLHPGHIVDQILAEPLEINRELGIDRRVTDAMKAVGLAATLRFRFAHELSGGQRQRVAIARAIIRQPHLLLLDEPTSALDASVQAEILNLLDEIKANRRLTMVLVSHDLAVIGHMCDRIIVMRSGKILERLAVEDLRTGRVQNDYTRQLLWSSEGFRRELSTAPDPAPRGTLMPASPSLASRPSQSQP